MKLDARAYVGAAMLTQMEMSVSAQQVKLGYIDSEINKIRKAIVSGEKTEDETNALFDRLQDLGIKKHYTEMRIRQLRRIEHDHQVEKKVQLEIKKLLPKTES